MKTCQTCFKLLQDKSRLKIISLLQKGPLKVNDLAKKLKIGQPTVSYHLERLTRAKMTKSKKIGRQVYYFLNEKYGCLKCNILTKIKC